MTDVIRKVQVVTLDLLPQSSWCPTGTASKPLPDEGERMAEAPTVRRRQLAGKLLRLRLAAGLDQEAVARVLECDDSKISRIETGRSGVRPMDLRALLRLYGVTDETEIEQMVRAARDSRRRGWWVRYGLAKPFASFISLEAEASAVRVFETQFVPGLLQTEGYMRALYKQAQRASPAEVDDLVKVRLERQRIHEIPSVELWFVIGEGALRHRIAEPEVMIDQLRHLMSLSEETRVEIQVLPMSSALYAAVDGPFNLLAFGAGEPEVAYEETASSGIFVEEADEVAMYQRAFRRLTAGALPSLESRQLMRDMIEDLRCT